MKKKPAKKPAAPSGKNQRERILAALLSHVAFDGWTEATYEAALQQCKVTRTEADKIFPDGLRDLVDLFSITIDETMQKRIAAERSFVRMRVRDKVGFAVRARFEALAPHREAMRRLMVWYAMPHHVPVAIKRTMKTADLVWVAAGDTATDYNFYTKRILLAGVMKATLLFWLGDESPGHAATWDFLDRRLGEVVKIGKGIGLMKEYKPSELVDMARDKIRRAI